jgi:hypothetical protein
MSDASTTRMIEMYLEEAEAPGFLAGFFSSPARNFHNTEKIEIDVIRDDEQIAIVISDLSVGPRANESNVFTNKAFTPPILDEKGAIKAYDLIQRRAGANPFDDPDFGANATFESFTIFRKLERKIRRTVELMASQVLQTGILTLTDSAGTELFGLDFQPKATHFITTGATWELDGSAGDPIADLEALALVIRRDGKQKPDRLIFGEDAMRRFLANPKVKDQLNFRRGDFTSMAPQVRGEGATFRGTVFLGHYEFEMWMYDGFFTDPVSSAHAPYVDVDKVIMMSSGGRLDLTFGAIPMFITPDSRALPFLPSTITSTEGGLSLTTNSWVTPDGKTLQVSAGTRPLTIPTAIDTFGALDVVI